MRLLFALILGLIVSTLAGSTVGVALAEWAQGDEAYILVFMAVPLVALIAGIFNVVAWTRPVPARAFANVAKFLLFLIAMMLGGLATLELGAAGTFPAAWRGIQLMLAMAASSAVTVIAQWLVFRWRAAKAATPPPPRFGRQPEARDA